MDPVYTQHMINNPALANDSQTQQGWGAPSYYDEYPLQDPMLTMQDPSQTGYYQQTQTPVAFAPEMAQQAPTFDTPMADPALSQQQQMPTEQGELLLQVGDEQLTPQQVYDKLQQQREAINQRKGWISNALEAIPSPGGWIPGVGNLEKRQHLPEKMDALQQAINSGASEEEIIMRVNEAAQSLGTIEVVQKDRVDKLARGVSTIAGFGARATMAFPPLSLGIAAAGTAANAGIQAVERSTNEVEGDQTWGQFGKDLAVGALNTGGGLATAHVLGVTSAQAANPVAITSAMAKPVTGFRNLTFAQKAGTVMTYGTPPLEVVGSKINTSDAPQGYVANEQSTAASDSEASSEAV